MERVLGSGIEWMRVPPIKKVMKARQRRIFASILAAVPNLPPEEPAAGAGALLPEAGTLSAEAEAGAGASMVSPRDAAGLPPEPVEMPPDSTALRSSGAEAAGLGAEPIPVSRLSRQLIERLGPEGAVEALVTVAYGEILDPARYGPVTEFPEFAAHEGGDGRRKGKGLRAGRSEGARADYGGNRIGRSRFHPGEARGGESRGGEGRLSRVYVGLGRRHGATARDVAGLLMRAGGVPGRLVESIEMKDFCAFATMPEDAARRACAFSRNTPQDPAIKPASPARD
jgi:ATP-dependent RNA helicase DeaD